MPRAGSASKAASDHLAHAWCKTFGLPVIISHCSNNYGPYQFPEKLIPLMILNGLDGISLPIYSFAAAALLEIVQRRYHDDPPWAAARVSAVQ